jgi:hypothetical protein
MNGESISAENIAPTNVFEQEEWVRRFSIAGLFFLSAQFDSSTDSFALDRHPSSLNSV